MNHIIMKSSRLMLSFLLILIVCLPGSSAAATAARRFPTPQAAADALIAAAEKYDVRSLETIFGPGGKEIISSGEPARDRELVKQFAEQARDEESRVRRDDAGLLAPGHAGEPVARLLELHQVCGHVADAPAIDGLAQECVRPLDIVMLPGARWVSRPGGGPDAARLQGEDNAALRIRSGPSR